MTSQTVTKVAVLNRFTGPGAQRQSNEVLRAIYERECQQCGICCVSHNQRIFSIVISPPRAQTPLTPNPEPEIPRRLIQIGPRGFSGSTRFLRIAPLKQKLTVQPWTQRNMALDRETPNRSLSKCVALNGRIGEQVECGIYESRPACCSNYDPGSLACIASREWAGMSDPVDVMALGRS